MPSDTRVIYSVVRVGRIDLANKQGLGEISPGFCCGARTGVPGLNGAGKSTLLRNMAGLDPNYTGEIAISKGYTTGLLEQEPQLSIKDQGLLQLANRNWTCSWREGLDRIRKLNWWNIPGYLRDAIISSGNHDERSNL